MQVEIKCLINYHFSELVFPCTPLENRSYFSSVCASELLLWLPPGRGYTAPSPEVVLAVKNPSRKEVVLRDQERIGTALQGSQTPLKPMEFNYLGNEVQKL